MLLQGMNLDLVLEKNEIEVRIGDYPCNVTSISSTQLNCAMPDSKTLLADDSASLPVIKVCVDLITPPSDAISSLVTTHS